MTHHDHYTKQQKYFTKEFIDLKNTPIQAWQESYIAKIRTNLPKIRRKDFHLLDIATGSGYVALAFAKDGVKTTACDLVDQSLINLKINKTRHKLANLKIIKCLAEDIPLPSACADFIVSSAILEHIPDEKKAIKEWKRLLKPGGKIFIAVPLKYQYLFPLFWPINYIHDKRIGHLRRYDRATLADRFKLKILKTYYTGSLIKVAGVLFQKAIGIHTFDTILETIDKKFERIPYWASNIIMVFQK